MHVAKRGELITRRGQDKASLTRIEKYVTEFEENPGLIEQIQVRFQRLPVIWEKYDDMQIELKINDKAGGHKEDR
jgi:hypothetical protein